MSTEKLGRASDPPEKQRAEADKRERQKVERVREVDPDEQSRMRKRFRETMEPDENTAEEAQPSPLNMMSNLNTVQPVGAEDDEEVSSTAGSATQNVGDDDEDLPSDPDFWKNVEFSSPSNQKNQQQQQQQNTAGSQDQQQQQARNPSDTTSERSPSDQQKQNQQQQTNKPGSKNAKKKGEEERKKMGIQTPDFMKKKEEKAKLTGFTPEQQKLIPSKMKPKGGKEMPTYPFLEKGEPNKVSTPKTEKDEKGSKKKQPGLSTTPGQAEEPHITRKKREEAAKKVAEAEMPSTQKMEKRKTTKKGEEEQEEFGTIIPDQKKEKKGEIGEIPAGYKELKEEKDRRDPRKQKEKTERLDTKERPFEKEPVAEKKKDRKKESEEAKGEMEIAPITSPQDQENRVHKDKEEGPKGVATAPSLEDLPTPTRAAAMEMTQQSAPLMRSPEVQQLFSQMVGTMIHMSNPRGDSVTEITLNSQNFKGSIFQGMTITVERFSTNPYSFNIRLSGPPQSINVLNANNNIEGLRSAFDRHKDRFHVGRLDTAYKTDRPLFRRKERAGAEEDKGQLNDER